MNISSSKVAELEERSDGDDNVARDNAIDGWKVDLERSIKTVNETELVVSTFMRAFESSPVHCLNPRPSWKCLSFENGGTTAILCNDTVSDLLCTQELSRLPPVNLG